MSQSREIKVDIQENQTQQSTPDLFHQQKNASQQNPQPSKRHHIRRSFHSYPSTIRIMYGHLVSLIIFLVRQLFRSNNLPFFLTFIWHSFLLKSLLFSSRNYLKRYTIGKDKRDISHAISVDVVKRLGGINSSSALLALLALIRFSRDMTAQKVALLVLAMANGTQTWLDFTCWKSGRWNWALLTKFGGGNGTIALVNIIAYGVSVAKTGSIL
ncbi:5260_t:CDS:1 [Funneliformis caledonium]|uniref:5260_t:CDS:1 n=1 Tax=Funneliformis caledonium TaxID=1117310 RepID=A0A9N9E3W7_9GLOM|nr:5260_t:CDS:1 [Funneliformis caledonium]